MVVSARRPVSLREWQEMFRAIYGKKDLRDYTLQDLLLHIQEEAAKIDEGIRKENNADMVAGLPHFFCWFLSLANMAGIDLEKAAWGKYPGICPY